MKFGINLVLLLAFGRVAALAALEPSLVRTMRGEDPQRGVVIQKDVGEVVYSKFDYTETTGVRLLEPFQTKHLARRIALNEGDFLTGYQRKKAVDFCSDERAVAGFQQGDTVCFRDTDDDGRFDQLHIPGTAFGAWAPIKERPLRYADGISLDASKGYRRELLYEGISGNVVRLTYREYIDDFVRPAFQQDLTYSLETGAPTEVGFRGARLRVHSASNQTISYEVLSGLRD